MRSYISSPLHIIERIIMCTDGPVPDKVGGDSIQGFKVMMKGLK